MINTLTLKTNNNKNENDSKIFMHTYIDTNKQDVLNTSNDNYLIKYIY